MATDDHDKLTELFSRAAEFEGEARRRFLDSACGDDRELRRRVEELLAHDERPAEILRTGELSRRAHKWTFPDPERIGPYRILKKVGSGGMGVVYRAEQEWPIRREVALKLIKRGFETEQVVGQFEAERQVLATLNHPNIAKVLDAGASEQGLPFFAMEFVAGPWITRFCDRNRLTVRPRLELFLEVCAGVRHAHRNGILHRDLKPGNVLVAEVDGKGVPKIIDFGIARALAGPREQETRGVRPDQLVGTPAFMSPEQAAGHPEGLDTRADVYSLGALLYDMLTGSPPLDVGDDDQTPEVLRRRIQNETPRRPSAQVLAAASGTTPRNGQAELLARRLRGELDWIVMKALEKDRSRRYGSVADLMADIRRHLGNEPVQARPASKYYLARKFVQRHRLAAVALTALIGFAVAMTVQAGRIAGERNRAQELSEVLVGFYDLPLAVTARHEFVSPRKVLAAALDRAGTYLHDRPVQQARLAHGIGDTLRAMGDYRAAEPVIRGARDRLAKLLGADHSRTLRATASLASALVGQSRFDEAEALLVATERAQRRLRPSADLDRLRTLRDLGYLHKLTLRETEAAVELEEALDGLRRQLGPDSPETLVTASLLATVYLDLDRLAEAEELFSSILPLLRQSGHAESRLAMYNLGCVYARLGRPAEAIRLLEEAFDQGFVMFSARNPHLASLMDEPEFIELNRRALRSNRSVQDWLMSEAAVLAANGRGDEAVAIYRGLVSEVHASQLGDPNVAIMFARLLAREQRYDEAEAVWTDMLRVRREQGVADPRPVGLALAELGFVRAARGDVEGGREALDEAIDKLGDHRSTLADVQFCRAVRAALTGDHVGAVRDLQAAADAGFWYLPNVVDNPVFTPIHEQRDYRSVVAQMRRRWEFP